MKRYKPSVFCLDNLLAVQKKASNSLDIKNIFLDLSMGKDSPHGPPSIFLLKFLMNKEKIILRYVLRTRQILMHWVSSMADGPPYSKRSLLWVISK